MAKIFWLAGVLALCYVGLLALMYLGQNRLIYFPTSALGTTPRVIGLDFEDIWFTTEDGVRIHGWYVAADDATATILMFHGNGGNISHRLDTLKIFNELGMNTLIIDYRGYGQSEGAPSEAGLYKDAAAAWQYLVERKTPDSDIILFGRSLGGAVAVWLTTNVAPRALILESTFTSLKDMGAFHYPWLPIRLLLQSEYDTISRISLVERPTLVIHSQDDRIIPFDHGQTVFERLPGPKYFLEIRGDHNQGFMLSSPAYMEGLKRFFDTVAHRS